MRITFARVMKSPIERAWGYLLNTVKHQLDTMPAELMDRAQSLRMFLNKAEKSMVRPRAVPGITLEPGTGDVFIWVSEAPGGVLASVLLPVTPRWSHAYHNYLGAMAVHNAILEESIDEQLVW